MVTDLIRLGHAVRFRVSGSSMLPAIRSGALVLAQPATALGLKVGDVVLYRRGERLLAHRMVAAWTSDQGARILLLRGDNHAFGDRPVNADDVLGRITRLEESGRDRARWMWQRLAGAVERALLNGRN